MNWKPTMELRILRRPDGGEGGWHEHALQQKWVSDFEDGDYVDGGISIHAGTIGFQWRDVPTVTEESK